MKKSAISPPPKGKSKSLTKTASVGLLSFLSSQYPQNIPIAALTAATKCFGKGRPLTRQDRTLKRLAGNKSAIPTSTLIDLISSQQTHEKGKPLTDQAVHRVYQNFANPDGKLTFEYIMKMGQSSGIIINDKMAKRIVRKYGKKDYLNADDCIKIKNRSQSKSLSKSPKK